MASVKIRAVQLLNHCSSQEGAVAVIVGIVSVMIFGFVALAIDISHLAVVRNELKNAADAGALAGARRLYFEDKTGTVNPASNQIANDTAKANFSDNSSVDINWTVGANIAGEDVMRGHWSFATKQFTYSNLTSLPANFSTMTTEELDADTSYVNAVQVTARRDPSVTGGKSAISFFARIFGYEGFVQSATSVAWLGYTGSLLPEEIDQPIAICREKIIDPVTKDYSCQYGRMIHSGSGSMGESGAWTDFNQDPGTVCSGTNTPAVTGVICAGGNPEPLDFGELLALNNGQVNPASDAVIDCWKNAAVDLNDDGYPETPLDGDGDGYPERPWNITLPVVTCDPNDTGDGIDNCEVLVGAVNVNVVWITDQGEQEANNFKHQPQKMMKTDGNMWTCDPATQGSEFCWSSFTDAFHLWSDPHATPPVRLDYSARALYFLPDCSYHEPAGGTGGEFFGILAKIPVLVK